MIDLRQAQATATAIARQAGQVLLTYYRRPHQEATKASIFDIVTEADTAIEAIIRPALLQAFPDHHVVGEEGGGSGAQAADAEYFWYVDPIDGTVNFAHDLPFFCVSIALADRNRVPLVGVVFNPVADELYSAAQGLGATLNGEPIHVRSTPDLTSAMLVTGFSAKPEEAALNAAAWSAFMPITRGLRRFGSAALDLCYVASGRVDGFWEPMLHPWDILGGVIIVREAGGKVTDYDGGAAKLYSGEEIVATNGPIHAAVLDVLNP